MHKETKLTEKEQSMVTEAQKELIVVKLIDLTKTKTIQWSPHNCYGKIGFAATYRDYSLFIDVARELFISYGNSYINFMTINSPLYSVIKEQLTTSLDVRALLEDFGIES